MSFWCWTRRKFLVEEALMQRSRQAASLQRTSAPCREASCVKSLAEHVCWTCRAGHGRCWSVSSGDRSWRETSKVAAFPALMFGPTQSIPFRAVQSCLLKYKTEPIRESPSPLRQSIMVFPELPPTEVQPGSPIALALHLLVLSTPHLPHIHDICKLSLYLPTSLSFPSLSIDVVSPEKPPWLAPSATTSLGLTKTHSHTFPPLQFLLSLTGLSIPSSTFVHTGMSAPLEQGAVGTVPGKRYEK